MLAKALPLLLLCACASTPEVPGSNQPELSSLAQPYAQQLRAAGITRVASPGNGADVRVETGYGFIYQRYPTGIAPLAFTLDIGPSSVQATAATFDRAKDAQVLAALLPEAVRTTQANNTRAWFQANPSH